MNLKATILLLLFASACAAPCAAQDKKKKETAARPDFSGTWVLDLSKSQYYGARGGFKPTAQDTLVISHGEPELRVKQTFGSLRGGERTLDLVYYTDGRGEKNTFVGRDEVSLSGTVASETKWKGARLVIRGSQRARSFGDVSDFKFTEKWELSADGQTLTQTTEYDVLWAAGGGPGDVQRSAPSHTSNIDEGRAPSAPPNARLVYSRAP